MGFAALYPSYALLFLVRGGCVLILAIRVSRRAAAPRLRFAPLQVFAQRPLQPLLARSMFVLAFIRLIVHGRAHRFRPETILDRRKPLSCAVAAKNPGRLA